MSLLYRKRQTIKIYCYSHTKIKILITLKKSKNKLFTEKVFLNVKTSWNSSDEMLNNS